MGNSRMQEWYGFVIMNKVYEFGKILEYMRHIAKHVYGLNVIYGDTDSIFVKFKFMNYSSSEDLTSSCSWGDVVSYR
jgi:DNA polymerase elongation subunit (family B)